MNRRIILSTPLILLAAVASPRPVAAGGFYVPEIGPRAAAMGGAMAAQAEDASAIFHNPAGIVGQTGTQFQATGTVFFPGFTYFRRPVEDPSSGEMRRFAPVENTNTVGAAPYLAAISDLGRSNLAAGIMLAAPFGAALSFPEDGSQRHVVTHVGLRAIHVSPTVAYKVSERIRVGLGINLIFADLALEQRNAIPFVLGDPEFNPDPHPDGDGDNTLKGVDPFSVTATLGAMYTDPAGRFNLGLSILTPTTLNFEGDAVIENLAIQPLRGEDMEELQPAGSRRDEFSSQMPLPLIVRAGLLLRPTEKVQIAADVNWQRWSSFDTLVIDFKNEYELLPTPGAYLYDIEVANAWRDTISLRLGTEVAPSETLPLRLRAGALYDQSPVEDQYFDLITPDSDKVGVSTGVGYTIVLSDGRELALDVAYSHIFMAEREVDPNSGSLKTILNKPAPSFYYGVTRAHIDLLFLSAGMRL